MVIIFHLGLLSNHGIRVIYRLGALHAVKMTVHNEVIGLQCENEPNRAVSSNHFSPIRIP